MKFKLVECCNNVPNRLIFICHRTRNHGWWRSRAENLRNPLIMSWNVRWNGLNSIVAWRCCNYITIWMEEGSVHCHWTNRILLSTVQFYRGTSPAKKLHRDKTQDNYFQSFYFRPCPVTSLRRHYFRYLGSISLISFVKKIQDCWSLQKSTLTSYHRIELLFLLLGVL